MDRLFTILIKKLFIMAIITLIFVDNSYAQQQCHQEVIVKNPSGDLSYGRVSKDSTEVGDEWFGPDALVIDSKGNIYVGDYLNYRILKFSKKGKFLLSFNLQPPKRHPLGEKKGIGLSMIGVGHYFPDIAVDKKDNVYLLNFFESRVEVYTPEGHFIKFINYSNDEILGSKRTRAVKKINIDVHGDIYLYTPTVGGGVYLPDGYLKSKGILVDAQGRGKVNFDEKEMVDYNGFYYEVDFKKLELIIKDKNNSIIKRCTNARIADAPITGIVYKTDKKGNIYTFDYYQGTLDVIKIIPFKEKKK
jgi:hypothetical protein